MVGDVLGLCGEEGSGLAGLSGTVSVALRGETHLERDDSGEPSRLRLALFLDRPLRMAPEAPVDDPGIGAGTVLSIWYLCPSEALV